MVDRAELRVRPAGRSIKGLLASYFQKRLEDGYWKNKTLGDANRVLCVAIGGAAGALVASAVGVAGASNYTCLFSTTALITAASAAGYLVSYFTEGLIFEALTGKSRYSLYQMSWLRDELTVTIRRVKQLPYLSRKDKNLMIKEAHRDFTKRVGKVIEGAKVATSEDTMYFLEAADMQKENR